MSGWSSEDDVAQLALMDAVVFFAVCAVTCATMVSCVAPEMAEGDEDWAGPSDLDGLLAAFVAASLGERIYIETVGVELTGSEKMGETILLVSSLILEGCSSGVFVALLSSIDSVLGYMCDPWLHELSVVSLVGGEWSVLLDIGTDMDGASEASSASQNLGACGGTLLMLTLVLSPPLLLHGL